MAADAAGHSASRTAAALLGTAPVALAIAVASALALPLPHPWRVAVGALAPFPLWVGLMCVTFLAPDGRRAWWRLGAAFAVAALVALAALALGRSGPALPGGP